MTEQCSSIHKSYMLFSPRKSFEVQWTIFLCVEKNEISGMTDATATPMLEDKQSAFIPVTEQIHKTKFILQCK